MEGLQQTKEGRQFPDNSDQEMYDEILLYLKSGHAANLPALKKKYLEKHPAELEWVEAIFGLREILVKQQAIEKEQKSGYKITKERYKDLTEYEFLFTNFILNNGRNKKFLQEFLDCCRDIAETYGAKEEMAIFWSGIRSQAAVYKILERIGENPKLATPTEDAYKAIDLWVEGEDAKERRAIQTKSARDVLEPAVLDSEHLAFPAVRTSSQRYFNSAEYFKNNAKNFLAKVEEYGKEQGKEIKAYMLVIPSTKVDFVTGEPSRDLVEFFRKELK